MNLISIAKMTWISLRKKLKSCLPTLYTANIPVMVRIAKKQRDSECNGGKEGFQHQKYCSIFIKKNLKLSTMHYLHLITLDKNKKFIKQMKI